MALAPLSQIPADVVAVDDYIELAKARMSPQAWAYFSGGVADERLLADNIHAWHQYSVMPRVLSDFDGANTAFSLLNKTHPFPIFCAPIAYQRMAHPAGELASALAAAAMETPYIISMQSSTPLEPLCEQAPGTKWLQWYWQTDESASQKLLSKAQALGIEAIVLTVDAPVNGLRNREQRAGFALPADIQAVLLEDFDIPPLPQGAPGESPIFGSGFLANTPNWDKVEQFMENCPLPVMLKGILHPLDAQKALEVGADGIIVSNHGARVLDILPPTARVLKSICDLIDGRIPVLVDGGIRRGSDVFIALALGATAVMIGRPYLYALAAAGAPGVAHVLHILRTELEVCMALSGCTTPAQIKSIELLSH
ncbi:L-lactate dehydrogenase [cytochrome] [Oligella urethralis]|uniref:alpha-hydroxy acid oxidase n=1 Tax=Oligella urethralis TaxID=90245 RepID=UPI000DF882B0|nr:alpha-hydroxy acid oxidase [Oligella urethralis]SUA94555.1 L-lactate dehydrogenase [cytochrome] [Oligella urethralis]